MNRRAPGAAVRVTPGTAAGLHMSKGKPHSRAVINQATGSIVISGDVTIGDVVVTHKNIVIEAGQAATFTAIDPDQTDDAKLEALVSALNSIKVPAEDIIEIIKGIHHNGKLHARLIVE